MKIIFFETWLRMKLLNLNLTNFFLQCFIQNLLTIISAWNFNWYFLIKETLWGWGGEFNFSKCIFILFFSECSRPVYWLNWVLFSRTRWSSIAPIELMNEETSELWLVILIYHGHSCLSQDPGICQAKYFRFWHCARNSHLIISSRQTALN